MHFSHKGSVPSFTISTRGNRSFAIGVAVCLRESVDKESQSRFLQTVALAYLNICSTPSVFASQPPRNLRPGMRSKSRWSEDEIIQYHVLAVNTQKQDFCTTAFVEPIHYPFEFAMFEALLGCSQKVSFMHLKIEFA